MIVVDANTIVYAIRDTSFTTLARAVYAKDSDWIAPPLWEAEVLNALLGEVRAGHINMADATQAARNAGALLKGKTQSCEPSLVLPIAEAAKLTAYDAYYVALARSLGVPLVTEDGRINRHCPDVARTLKAFLELPDGPAALREAQSSYGTRRSKKRPSVLR